MTKLYVANCTKQHHQFNYRIPEVGLRQQPIRAGHQAQIGSDLTSAAVDYILKNAAPYGVIPAEEAGKRKGFNGLCYSLDKPVKLKDMHLLFERNEHALEELGAQIREEGASEIASSVDGGSEALAHLEVEVVEETKPGQKPKVAQGYEISKDGSSRRGGKPSARRKR